MKVINIFKLSLAVAFAQVANTNAASVFFESTTFAIRGSNGVQLSNTAVSKVALGYFSDGFTATAANYSSWLSNFKGVTGYHNVLSASQPIGNNLISASITILTEQGPGYDPENGDLNYIGKIGSSQAGSVIGFGANEVIAENKQFSLIVWNSDVISSATQAGVYTGASWLISPTYLDNDSSASFNLQFGANVLTSVVGSSDYTTNARFVQLAAIPEPSSASLLALGVAGLVALRARRKS
jgi:hypothetical protein